MIYLQTYIMTVPFRLDPEYEGASRETPCGIG